MSTAFPLINQVGHFVIEGDQVGQAGAGLHEPLLTEPDPSVFSHEFYDLT